MESFDDGLRAYNPNDEKMRIKNAQLQKDVSVYLDIFKGACTGANLRNKKSVSCFCVSRQDDGYTEAGVIERLPTVQDYIQEAEKFNKERYTTNSTYHYADTGKYETRLYGELLKYKPEDLDYAKELRHRLHDEISKMGFTSFKVSLIELDDIYVIHNRTTGLLSSTIKESISTRVAGKIYAFRFEASW